MTGRSDFQTRNRLLGALPPSDYALLQGDLKEVDLEHGLVLQDQGERIHHVYLPLSGMIALLSVMRDGKAVQTIAFGNDGTLGASYGLGNSHSASRAMMQIEGRAARIGAAQFQRAVKESDRLRDLILRYKESRLAVVTHFEIRIPQQAVYLSCDSRPDSWHTPAMPTRSSKRPTDANQLGKLIVDLSVGESGEGGAPPQRKKNPAAVALGRLGGQKGGAARANALSAKKRVSIARKAARARWGRDESGT